MRGPAILFNPVVPLSVVATQRPRGQTRQENFPGIGRVGEGAAQRRGKNWGVKRSFVIGSECRDSVIGLSFIYKSAYAPVEGSDCKMSQ